MYQILENCMTGHCSEDEVAALGGTVLGIPFNPQEDEFMMRVTPTVVVEGKKRKKRIAVLF